MVDAAPAVSAGAGEAGGDCACATVPLGPAQGRHLVPGEVLVETAGIAVGHHAVDHLDPGVRPARDGSGGREVHVVGVGGDGQDPADLGVIEHAVLRHMEASPHGRLAQRHRPLSNH